MNILLKLIGGSQVEPDEWPAVRLLLVHSLALGLFRAFYVSFANTQFLDVFEVSSIPIAFLVSGGIGWLAMLAFSRLQRRIPFSTALLVDLVFVLLLTGGFWAGFAVSSARWVSFALFAWMGPVQALVDLEFWGVAGKLFNLQQGKRLYGLIGAGEALASIAGFFVVPFVFRFAANPSIMLLLAAGALGVCIVVLLTISKRFKHALADAAPTGRTPAKKSAAGFRADRYFIWISLVTVAFILVMYSVDFAFLAVLKEGRSREEIGQFIGIFFGLAKIAELLSKLFFSGWLLRQFGVIAGIMVMPVAVLMCVLPASVVGVVAGSGVVWFFLLIAAAKFLEFGLRKSVFEPSSRVLFQPLPSEQRFATQTRVDGVIKQIAVGVAGGLLVLFSQLGSTSTVVVAIFLVLVTGGWLAVARPLFHEYRGKLLTILSSLPKKALLASPMEVIRRRLHQSPAVEVGYSLNVLRSIEPGLMGELVVELLESDRSEVRLEALAAIERAHWMSAAQAVARRAREETEPEVRRAAERTAAALAALRLEEMTAATIAEHAASADPRERLLAALALVRRPEDAPADLLGDLLWDDHRQVRRVAVAVAGLSGEPQLWPRLVDLLAAGEFFKSAGAALARIGEPVLETLELGFKKFAQDGAVMCRVLRIYERIGGPRAERLLFEKIEYPHREVQRQALNSLGFLAFHATAEQSGAIKGRIEETIDTVTWYVAGIRDLEEEPTAAGLVGAMKIEVDREVELIYLLLALISDPQAIRLMQVHLSGGGAEDRAFALEIAEQLVPEDSRELVFPILEDLPPQQLLDRLRFYFPQHRLGVGERLREILSRGSARVNPWVRACAIFSLGLLDCDEVPAELAANLYSSDPMTREMAARTLRRIDAKEYRRRLAGLTAEDRHTLAHIGAGDGRTAGGQPEQMLIFDKALLLAQTPIFGGLPNTLLADFAARTVEDRLEAETTLFREGDPGRDMYIVVEGRLRIDKDGQTLSHVEERQPLGEIAVVEATTRSASATAMEPTHLLRIGSNAILDLMAEHMEIMPLMVQTIARRRARG